MPARDGTGPAGQGSRTGRALGNCTSTKTDTTRNGLTGIDRPYGQGRSLWDSTFGRFFVRRRGRGANRR